MQNMLEGSSRRILAIWLPRLGAERVLRRARGTLTAPLAIVRETGNLQLLVSLSEDATAEGLSAGQPLRDAVAMCPALITERENAPAEAAF
ncbi:MAG: DNA polymerase Y family protein, partial [Pseudomonadota bacterium]